MHGSGGLPPVDRLWWGRATQVSVRRAGLPPVVFAAEANFTAAPADLGALAPWQKVHNVFPSTDWQQRYLAGGLIDQFGAITDVAALHASMKTLAGCIDRASIGSPGLGDNPNIPSGYTYLLQFVAHDMTDSVSAVTADGAKLRPLPLNKRQRPLMLDTLYGEGPESDSQAYMASLNVLAPSMASLRTRLRVGAEQPPKPGSITALCPYRDVVRAKSPSDDGLPAGESWYTEAYLADRRNDSHAFLSQLTVLFQLLHNAIITRLEALPASTQPMQGALRQFLCARNIATLIYREIVAQDLLPRILDPAVMQRYRSQGKAFFYDHPQVSVEFIHGAFRFAHAIVRDNYKVRDAADRSIFTGLQFNSMSSPRAIEAPATQEWFVDWARFFDSPAAGLSDPPNRAKLIGPHFASALRLNQLFPPKTTADGAGLPNRDLLSASYAGLLSVKALSAKFQAVFSTTVVRNFDDWKRPLHDWLTAHWPGNVAPPQAEIDRLVEDPPLPFFILFEAARANGGITLGPIGSVIVAETMFGALQEEKTGFEVTATLAGNVSACAAALFPGREAAARAAVAPLGTISTMPQLLAFLAADGLVRKVP